MINEIPKKIDNISMVFHCLDIFLKKIKFIEDFTETKLKMGGCMERRKEDFEV